MNPDEVQYLEKKAADRVEAKRIKQQMLAIGVVDALMYGARVVIALYAGPMVETLMARGWEAVS